MRFRLARFVFATFTPALPMPTPSLAFEGALAGIRVEVLGREDEERQTRMAIAGLVELQSPPSARGDRVVVPTEPRRQAEAAIEAYANLIGVGSGSSSTLGSPPVTVGLQPLSPDAGRWLSRMRHVHGQERFVSYPFAMSTISIGDGALERMDDRLDGVALLASSLHQRPGTGHFLDLFRLFERAFAVPARRAVPLLDAFLAPRFGYSHNELAAWVNLRDRATHADSPRQFVLGGDLRPVIARVQQAAYDVLLNKREWHSSRTERTERWHPRAWTESAAGDSVALAGAEIVSGVQLLDQFGAYPPCEGTIGAGDEWWIPAVLPQTTDRSPLRVIAGDAAK